MSRENSWEPVSSSIFSAVFLVNSPYLINGYLINGEKELPEWGSVVLSCPPAVPVEVQG